jgi:hypothetical protein
MQFARAARSYSYSYIYMGTIKTVSVVSKRELGSEVDCCGNYKKGICGFEKRLQHGRERHVLHSVTGSSKVEVEFFKMQLASKQHAQSTPLITD